MAQKICPECGTVNDENARFCSKCGVQIVSNYKQVETVADPESAKKYSQEDLEARNKEIEKGRKEQEKKEKEFERNQNREERRKKFFIFSIVSIVLTVAGLVLSFTLLNTANEWGQKLFTDVFTNVSSTMWKSFVREGVTFFIWLIAIMFVFIGFGLVYVVLCLSGPALLLIGAVFGCLQIRFNKKWWSIATLVTGLTGLIVAIVLVIVKINLGVL